MAAVRGTRWELLISGVPLRCPQESPRPGLDAWAALARMVGETYIHLGSLGTCWDGLEMGFFIFSAHFLIFPAHLLSW